MSFKEKLLRFMQGRYGVDRLYYVLTIGALVFVLLGVLTRWPLFPLLALAAMIWSTYRCYSRNLTARRRENDALMRLWNRVRGFFSLTGKRLREGRTHVYHKCPHCGAMLRLPRRRGKHTVRCPRCQESFALHVRFGGRV